MNACMHACMHGAVFIPGKLSWITEVLWVMLPEALEATLGCPNEEVGHQQDQAHHEDQDGGEA